VVTAVFIVALVTDRQARRRVERPGHRAFLTAGVTTTVRCDESGQRSCPIVIAQIRLKPASQTTTADETDVSICMTGK